MVNEAYTRRTMESHTLYSAHLEEDRTIKVYLPPDYNPHNRRYPVLYTHDGGEFYTHGRLATIATERILAGQLPPLIIVGLAVNMKTRVDDYSPDGHRHQAYLRFITDECRPFIAERYAVRVDKADQWMAGISLGAAASLSIHLTYPSLFSNLLLFSGAYNESLEARVRETADLSELSAFMVVGTDETAVQTDRGVFNFYEINHTMRNLLRVRGADIDYEEAAGKHLWGFWQGQLPRALDWLATRL